MANPDAGFGIPRHSPTNRSRGRSACQNGFAEGKGVMQSSINGKLAGRVEGSFVAGKLTGHAVLTTSTGRQQTPGNRQSYQRLPVTAAGAVYHIGGLMP